MRLISLNPSERLKDLSTLNQLFQSHYIGTNMSHTAFEDHSCTQDGLRAKENIYMGLGPNKYAKEI